MSKLIYIASPYSHPDDNIRIENFRKVSAFAAKLVSEGFVPITPITYGHTLLDFREMPNNWEFWRNFCITFLNKCDEMIVYKMDGWDKSRGVLDEIDYANKLGIPIKYVEYERIF